MAMDGSENELSGTSGTGASDLGEALGGSSEAEFVVEQSKQPLNKSSLVLFGLMLMGGAVIYFMYLRSGPKAADASTAVEAAAAKETITEFLGSGETNVKLMEQMLRDTEKVVQQFLKYPSATQIPLTELKTNPFRQGNGADQAASATPGSDSEALAKKRREEERQRVLKAVQGLQLQSVIAGTRKACMINGTLYTEGQQVETFTIEKISSAGVIVKNGVYRFELKMAK